MTPCPPCVDSERPRVYVRNVPVCTGTTSTSFNTCARGAGIHGDVLNVHTEAFLKPNTVFPRFFCVPQHTQTHTHTHTKHTPRPPTTPRPQRHTPHNTTHNITRRQRETERDRERQRETEKEDKERQDKR